MAVGRLELRQRLAAMRSAGGQASGGPNGVCDQSRPRIRSPSSPPPSRKGKATDRSIVGSESVRLVMTACRGPEPSEKDEKSPSYGGDDERSDDGWQILIAGSGAHRPLALG